MASIRESGGTIRTIRVHPDTHRRSGWEDAFEGVPVHQDLGVRPGDVHFDEAKGAEA